MPLDPQAAALYGDRLHCAPPHPSSVAQARLDADSVFHDKESWRTPVFSVEDRQIPTSDGSLIPIRIYTPFCPSPQDASRKPPLMLYFHGGGFVMHNIASHDSLCRKLSLECRCIVISVGYRLAPEHKHPACMEDGCAALFWAYENAQTLCADAQRIILAGDSAGASISAAVSLLARDRCDFPALCLQVLCYGSFGCVPEDQWESELLFGNGGFVLPRTMLDWCMEQYIPKGADPSDPLLNPGRATDLSKLPPALCITAEYDPLRDDGEAFARLLRSAGNQVLSYRTPGMMHGFLLYWEKLDSAQEILRLIGKTVQNL